MKVAVAKAAGNIGGRLRGNAPRDWASPKGARRDGYNSQLLRMFHRQVSWSMALTGFLRPLLRSLVRPGSPWSWFARWAVPGNRHVFPTLRTYGVYMLDINQGNYLSQDMVDKLKVGMTNGTGAAATRHAARRQPLPRHRWDYVYEFTRRAWCASIGRSPSTSSTTSSRDGKATRMPISVAELNKSAAAITRRGAPGPIRGRGGSSFSTSSRNERRGGRQH
jgi:hypothetical protein